MLSYVCCLCIYPSSYFFQQSRCSHHGYRSFYFTSTTDLVFNYLYAPVLVLAHPPVQQPRPYRGALHDVPPDGLVPAALAEVQQVVHHHLADQVVSGEAVEVVHREVQLPGMQLVQRHPKLKRLVEHWV